MEGYQDRSHSLVRITLVCTNAQSEVVATTIIACTYIQWYTRRLDYKHEYERAGPAKVLQERSIAYAPLNTTYLVRIRMLCFDTVLIMHQQLESLVFFCPRDMTGTTVPKSTKIKKRP